MGINYQEFSQPLLWQVAGGSPELKEFAAFRLWTQRQEAELEEMLEEERQLLAPTYKQLRMLPECYSSALIEKLDDEFSSVETAWRSEVEDEIAEEFIGLLNRLGFTISGNFFDCNLKISDGVEFDDRTLDLVRRYERALCSAAPQDIADLSPKQLEALRERERLLGEQGINLPGFASHTGPVRYDQKSDTLWGGK